MADKPVCEIKHGSFASLGTGCQIANNRAMLRVSYG